MTVQEGHADVRRFWAEATAKGEMTFGKDYATLAAGCDLALIGQGEVR